jgi:hypothetical protein
MIISVDHLLQLPTKAFLAALYSNQELPYRSNKEKQKLSQKTVKDMIIFVYGNFSCLCCGVGPGTQRGRIEGHHVFTGTMKISEYMHCIKACRRHRRLSQLCHELEQHVIPLCKYCHEKTHHAPAM